MILDLIPTSWLAVCDLRGARRFFGVCGSRRNRSKLNDGTGVGMSVVFFSISETIGEA